MPIRQPRRPSGFTLAELLIVVAIIAVLIGLVGFVASKARGGADRVRLGAQLQAIATALEAYKTDFDAYPITSLDAATAADNEINRVGLRGARTLCKALLAPGPRGTIASPFTDAAHQDGSDGLGFRVLPRSGVFQQNAGDYVGKVYGPYLSESQFKYSKTTTTGALDPSKDYTVDADTAVILDGNGQPILYYPVLNGQANIGLPYSYLSADPEVATTSTPMYRSTDNSLWLPTASLRILLGDVNANNMIGAGETAAVRGKYILWSAGTDGLFGPRSPDGTTPSTAADIQAAIKQRYDDVTNFQGE